MFLHSSSCTYSNGNVEKESRRRSGSPPVVQEWPEQRIHEENDDSAAPGVVRSKPSRVYHFDQDDGVDVDQDDGFNDQDDECNHEQ
jgi:hypothetical protein